MSRLGIAALLSALVPGLGQTRLGASRRGALIALPFVGLLVAGAAMILDPKAALDTLLSAGVLVILLVVVIVLAVYHLAAIVDAFRLGNRLGATQDPPVARRRALRTPLLHKYPLPDGTGYTSITILAGCRKLNGEVALEYARSRHMDSDYGRMQRQQRVLVAVARQLDPIALLPRVPELLDIAQENLFTKIPMDQVANLAVLAARVDAHDIQTIQLSPPTYPEYLNAKAVQKIRDHVAAVFEEPAASPSPTPDASPQPCPRK